MDINTGDDGILCKNCGRGQWGADRCQCRVVPGAYIFGHGYVTVIDEPKKDNKKEMKCKAKDSKQSLPAYVFMGQTRCDLCHKKPLLQGFHDTTSADVDLCSTCFERWNIMVARSCAKCGVRNSNLANFIEFVENK